MFGFKKFLFFIVFLVFITEVYAGQGIPEPMLFDLIRPLDSKKGEFEINTLTQKSFEATNKNRSSDPFGSGATTYDMQKIEWAPEIEYAISDGFAVEFELPMEGQKIEAYKFAAQYTFGRVSDSYIHGVQFIVEPNYRFENYNTTLLYLGGYRFSEIFSTLFMLGGRKDLEGDKKNQSFEYLANGSLFAELNHTTTIGLETNYSYNDNNRKYALAVVPQIHYEVHKHIELQAGVSFGEAKYAKEKALVFRVIFIY